MSQCKKFAPNIFHKIKCSNCFRQKEEHSAEALECNRASRSIARSGYLFVAPDWDFSVPLNRTKRWQRRWFVLYDDGELNYSVDEHPDTVPQGSVDMSKVLEVTGAEQITGHPHSLALTGPDRVTFVKAASREDARWWAELLAVFPRRHKRNATFPGGRASPSLPQFGRSASPQPSRPRHLSCTTPTTSASFTILPYKKEETITVRPKITTLISSQELPVDSHRPEVTSNWTIERAPSKTDYVITSGSPPTRDKHTCDKRIRSRKDSRNERLRDVATALTDRTSESYLTLPAEGLLNFKKGWLWYKEKNTEKEWLKRWWVLCGQTLNAYVEQDEKSIPEIIMDLSNVVDVSEVVTDSRYGFQIIWSGSTYILSAVTAGIRSNWLQVLKKAIPIADSPPTSATPRSGLLSSDEEYRTASEGGRRDSEDWGDLPPSPPLSRTLLAKVKEKTRARPKLPRNQSRQSTLDSVSTDELDACKELNNVEIQSSADKHIVDIDELNKQLANALNNMQYFETELIRFQKLQSESEAREQQAKEHIQNLEKSEINLVQKLKQVEEKHHNETQLLHCRLLETEQVIEKNEEKYLIVSRELQAKQKIISSLQEEVGCINERYTKSCQENDRLYKKFQELECKPHRRKRLDSLTDLTDIDMDLDFNTIGHTELIEKSLDLRNRFEKAVIEIKAMKRELRDSHTKYDHLELQTIGLRKSSELSEQEALAQSTLMADRVRDLTAKLAASEKQVRHFKSKLQDSREKRRSLSLKGRENFSLNKEIEDKITELEAKVLVLERGRSRRKHKRERSSERASPIDDRSLRRLRRKSLDSATTSEPIKLFMRLNNLEGKITNAATSNESLNILPTSYSDKKTDEISKCLCAESVILAAIKKLEDCKCAFNLLKSNRNNIIIDKLNALENNLNQLGDILTSNISENEFKVIQSSADVIVKQLEQILKAKLESLYEKRRTLAESKQLNEQAKIEILAEKIAYENIIINRIHQALNISTLETSNCERLLYKEGLETVNLISSLNGKLNGTVEKQIPSFKTSVNYLTKVLTKRLLASAHGYSLNKHVKSNVTFLLTYLEEEQAKLKMLLNAYKANKLPQLADLLALETLNLALDSSTLGGTIIDDVWKSATKTIDCELMESEINHVMLQTAQMYEESSSSDQNYFFSFFAYERAALELWLDTVEVQLHIDMDKNIEELIELFKGSINKLQKQNHKRKLESERSNSIDTLLNEFADIISHKALIDARINVFQSQFKAVDVTSTTKDNNFIVYLQSAEKWHWFEEIGLVSADQSLEAQFKCLLENNYIKCNDSLMRNDLIAIQSALQSLSMEVIDIINCCTGRIIEDVIEVNNLHDVCIRCQQLKSLLIELKQSVVHKNIERSELEEDRRPLYLGTEYLNQVENLRAAYRQTLTDCEGRRKTEDIEQLQVLCEQVLVAMEHWHRKTLQDLREQHTRELHALRLDKEQALAEETQATLAALDAMRKAHEAEVQREVAKFKQDFARQRQDQLLELTERLSVKCLEAAALEEQLGSTRRQLVHAQQHITKLEGNPRFLVQN